MITSTDFSKLTKEEISQRIDFYKNHYATVELVQCMECKSDLCLELTGLIGAGLGLSPNAMGVVVIPLNEKLLSTRIRLDETGTGEPMRGYQCACGNDSRVSEQEIEAGVTAGQQPTETDPFTKHMIREKLRAKNVTGNFKVRGQAKYFDKFKVVHA